jgi:hypothetical protein
MGDFESETLEPAQCAFLKNTVIPDAFGRAEPIFGQK